MMSNSAVAVEDLLHGQLDVRQRVAGVAVRPQRLGDGRDVPAGHDGVAAREGRDLVAAAVELARRARATIRSVPP